jgi:Uncharacterized protein conserved in bacteria
MKRCVKEALTVIGKQGSTKDGAGFIQKLWQEANARFSEIAPLAKKDEAGDLAGFWGAMSDFSLSFLPWEENFSKGLYLAGAECVDGAEPPEEWVKWEIPAYEYVYMENAGPQSFSEGIEYLKASGLSLDGAVHEFNCPKEGKGYLFFPIRRL